jgi:hypothetical protein
LYARRFAPFVGKQLVKRHKHADNFSKFLVSGQNNEEGEIPPSGFSPFQADKMVRATGIEPVTPCLSSKYSNQLS